MLETDILTCVIFEKNGCILCDMGVVMKSQNAHLLMSEAIHTWLLGFTFFDVLKVPLSQPSTWEISLVALSSLCFLLSPWHCEQCQGHLAPANSVSGAVSPLGLSTVIQEQLSKPAGRDHPLTPFYFSSNHIYWVTNSLWVFFWGLLKKISLNYVTTIIFRLVHAIESCRLSMQRLYSSESHRNHKSLLCFPWIVPHPACFSYDFSP